MVLLRPQVLGLIIAQTAMAIFMSSCGFVLSQEAPNPIRTFRPTDFSSYTLDCDNGARCDGSVGALLRSEFIAKESSYSRSRCTFFLVADDIIATNNHCLPEANRTHYSSLIADDVFALFPMQVSGSKKLIKVIEVIYTVPATRDAEGELQPSQDYAFLRLQEPVRYTPIQFSEEKLFVGKAFYSTVVNSKASATDYKLTLAKVSNVRIADQTLIFRHTYDSMFDEISLFGDKFRTGNSGSPVFDLSGRAAGVMSTIFWGVKDGKYPFLGRYWIDNLMQFESSIEKHSLAFNLKCARGISQLPESSPDSCRPLTTSFVAPSFDYLNQELPSIVRKLNSTDGYLSTSWFDDAFYYRFATRVELRLFFGTTFDEYQMGRLTEVAFPVPLCSKRKLTSRVYRKSFEQIEIKRIPDQFLKLRWIFEPTTQQQKILLTVIGQGEGLFVGDENDLGIFSVGLETCSEELIENYLRFNKGSAPISSYDYW